jgi:predicted CXXCH cytochrome family protein
MPKVIKYFSLIFLSFLFAGVAFAQKKDYSKPCSSEGCHKDKVDYKHKHAVIEPCETCHGITDEKNHKFSYLAEGKALCYMCHENYEENKAVNHIVNSGDSCTMCHNPHGSSSPKLLTMEKNTDLCGMCHGTDLFSKKFRHGPLQADDCISCHNPHASNNPKLLLSTGKALCEMCHGDMSEEFKKARSVHSPARFNCTSCHDPHSSNYAKYLTMKTSKLCFSCHQKAVIVNDKTVKGHSKKDLALNCTKCHQPHWSKYPLLLRTPPKRGCPVKNNK